MRVLWDISFADHYLQEYIFLLYYHCGLQFEDTSLNALIEFHHNQLFVVTNHILQLRTNSLRAGLCMVFVSVGR